MIYILCRHCVSLLPPRGKGFLPASIYIKHFFPQEYDIDDYRDGTYKYHQGDVLALEKYCICVLRHSTTY